MKDIKIIFFDIDGTLIAMDQDTISEKTINHTVEIFSKCGKENCFGRTIVEEITGLKPSGASKFRKNIRSIKATTGKRSQTLFGNRKRTDACPTF